MGFIKNVAATGLLAAQAVGLNPTATAADPVAPKKPTSVTRVEPAVSDLFAARVEAEKKAETVTSEEMVTKQDGTKLPKSEYINLVISNAQRDGIIKSESHPDFQIKDLSAQAIVDQSKYGTYLRSIREKASQFKNPKDFSSFVNAMRVLGQSPDGNPILKQEDREFLINHDSYVLGYDYLKRIKGYIETGATTEQTRDLMSKFISNLK